MKRPSVEASLKPLKSFQRRTVEHAFHRLFTADDSTGRFLVADEVGLGKTLVARGIIARAIDHLWNDVERIDIVYICSNGSIARANLPKLQVGGAEQRSFALATRLVMLATELAHREGESRLADSKLNFVSFTPGTSFNMGHSAGRGREREVLFQLLDPLVGPRTALMNLLQGGITRRDRWRSRLENYPRPIDDTIRQGFEAAFHEETDLQGRLRELLATWFRRYRSWPAEARHPRDRVISDLRRMMAGAYVRALEPDLVSWTSSSASSRCWARRGPSAMPRRIWPRSCSRPRRTTASECARFCFPRPRTSSTPPTRRSSTRSTTRISSPPSFGSTVTSFKLPFLSRATYSEHDRAWQFSDFLGLNSMSVKASNAASATSILASRSASSRSAPM